MLVYHILLFLGSFHVNPMITTLNAVKMKREPRLISIKYTSDETDFNRESNDKSFANDVEKNPFIKSHIEHSSTDSAKMKDKSGLNSIKFLPDETDFSRETNHVEDNTLKKSHGEDNDHGDHIAMKEKSTLPQENPSTDSIEELIDIITSIFINSIKFQIFAETSREHNIFGNAYQINNEIFIDSTVYNGKYLTNELVEFKLEEVDEKEIDTKNVNNGTISAWKTENVFEPETIEYINKPHLGLVHDEVDNPDDRNCDNIKFSKMSSNGSTLANIFVHEQRVQNTSITVRGVVPNRNNNYNILEDESQWPPLIAPSNRYEWPPLETPSSYGKPFNGRNAATIQGEPRLISIKNISEDTYFNTESHKKMHTNIHREFQQEIIEKSNDVLDMNKKITLNHIGKNKKGSLLKQTDNSPNLTTSNFRTDILYISDPKQVNKIVKNVDNVHKKNKGQLKGIVKVSHESQDRTRNIPQKIKNSRKTVNDKSEIKDDYKSSMEKNIQIIINKTHFVIDEYAYNTIVFLGDNIKRCFVCSTYIYHGCMHKHIISDEHSENISKYKFLDTYSKHLIRQKILEYHCGICNVIIGHDHLINHLDWKIHQRLSIQCKTKKSMRNSIKMLEVATQKEQKYLNAIVPKIKIFLHVRIVATLKTTEDKMENKKVILNGRILTIGFYNWHGICKSNKNSFNCIICKEKVSGDVVEHCNGHYNGVLNNILEEYLPALIRQINATLAHCIICNSGLLNIKPDIYDHINLKKHLKNYNDLIKKSTVLTTSEYDEFHNKITVKVL